MSLDTVGQRIRALRLVRRIKQADLARRCGIQAASLWRIETQSGPDKRRRTPSRALCIKIAEILGCSLDWLLIGIGLPDDVTSISDLEGAVRAEDFDSCPTIPIPRPEAAR